MTIQGQRVVTTTGIKCEGNAVMLQGVPYPQPYVIEAVGDPARWSRASTPDDYLAGYRADAAVPDIAVGWDLRPRSDSRRPAYDGLLDLQLRRAALGQSLRAARPRRRRGRRRRSGQRRRGRARLGGVVGSAGGLGRSGVGGSVGST